MSNSLTINTSTLIGFISIFEHDGDKRLDLSPWYATMFVKKKFRGMGYSRLLNDAIFIEYLNNEEKLYCINL